MRALALGLLLLILLPCPPGWAQQASPASLKITAMSITVKDGVNASEAFVMHLCETLEKKLAARAGGETPATMDVLLTKVEIMSLAVRAINIFGSDKVEAVVTLRDASGATLAEIPVRDRTFVTTKATLTWDNAIAEEAADAIYAKLFGQ